MPLYEYKCRACSAEFEELAVSSTTPPPPCPNCASPDTERLMSRFGSIGSNAFGGSSCGRSGFT